MDTVEILARIQFAVTVSFHYIYPPLSIGLGVIIVIMEGMFLKTKNPLYEQMTKFWIRIFALTFAIGVATGIVMEFEFGTNWSTYSRYVGDIFGSALAAEGIFAFFLESGFLGLLLFGWNRISPAMHFFAAIMVSLGSMFSAVWIVVAGSWMQTPAGFHIVGSGLTARAEITDFWAMVFNPSSMERLAHVLGGAWIAGAFLVLSVSAYYIIKKKHTEFAQSSFKIALGLAAFGCLFQFVTGHISAEGVSRNQPAKMAAYEGHFDSNKPADQYLIGWVNEKTGTTSGLAIPGFASFLVHGDASKPLVGLNSFAPQDRPMVNPVFQMYHWMIVIGVTLTVMVILAYFLMIRKRLFETRWLMMLFVPSVILPQLANQFGWFAAEMGRQPWIVYGLLRTSDALSKVVTANQIWFSLILFTAIYILLFLLFVYLMHKKITKGPVETDESTYSEHKLVMPSLSKNVQTEKGGI